MSEHGLTPKEILEQKNSTIEKVNTFYEYCKWTDDDYVKYEKLLNEFNNSYKKCSKKIDKEKQIKTKEKGDALENIVNFIIDRSFFLEVYNNVRTSTNEIDQFITISDYGFQSLHDIGVCKDLLHLEDDFFLGECKNYDKSVPVTWVGKFNTLLDTCGNCKLGIIFSYFGLTGKENSWYDAHGLTKIMYKCKKRFIIDFKKEDFEQLKNKNINIFKIIKAKKKALQSSSECINFYESHEAKDKLLKIFNDFKNN